MIIKESREELLQILQNPSSEYLDVCPFCQKRIHTKRETIICVFKKFIAQGLIPENSEIPDHLLGDV